jgi:hypothetical protein
MNGFQRLARSAQVFEPCVILKPEKICIGAHSRIDTFTKLEGGQGLDIGEYVHVASFCHTSPEFVPMRLSLRESLLYQG